MTNTENSHNASESTENDVVSQERSDDLTASSTLDGEPDREGNEEVSVPLEAANDSQTPIPTPHEGIKPGPSLSSGASASSATPQADASQSVETPKHASRVHEFGRMDENGNIFVIDNDVERLIGSYPAELPDDPFEMYARRFADIEVTIRLFEERLQSLSPQDVDSTLVTIREAVKQPAALGDLRALRQHVAIMEEKAQERKAKAREEREAQRAAALESRTTIVEKAEALAAQEATETHWKQSGQVLKELLDEWKDLQRKGPRLDRSTEEKMWKRFSGARTLFDRKRRQFFSALDQKQLEARKIKEDLIKEAETLQTSTDWARTSAAYRELMDRWKAAPRASRKEDDALWARFRASQQVFFDARRSKDEAEDAESEENRQAKEELLVQAEALLPITDSAAMKAKLRQIQDQWDKIGAVPRAVSGRMEARMRSVEDALRQAEDHAWNRSNPEVQARATGMLGQLEDQVAQLASDLQAAEAAGDSKKAQSLRESLETKNSWLEQIRSSMDS